VSWSLAPEQFLFVNVDLSAHLQRLPRGEWVCLDAVTTPDPVGVGLADTALWDEGGPIGRSVQTLLIDRRAPETA
jgi:hypothetical protein